MLLQINVGAENSVFLRDTLVIIADKMCMPVVFIQSVVVNKVPGKNGAKDVKKDTRSVRGRLMKG